MTKQLILSPDGKSARFKRNWKLESRTVDAWSDGELPRDAAKAIKHIETVAKEHPEALEVQAFLISFLIKMGLHEEAARHADVAVPYTESLIPADFTGTISYNELDNRSYLRLLYNSALAYSGAGRAKEGLALLDLALRRDPDDRIGAAVLRPYILLRAGEYQAAADFFSETRHSDATGVSYFLAALAHLRLGQHVDAVKVFLEGMTFNPYLAERLAGRNDRSWDYNGGGLATPGHVENYAEDLELWAEDEDFAYWLWNHPDVLPQLAEWRDLRWQFLTGKIEAHFTRVEIGLTDELIAEIVAPVTLRGEPACLPWKAWTVCRHHPLNQGRRHRAPPPQG